MIASVALAFLGLGLSVLAAVGGERTALIVTLLELTLLVTPHISFVRSGVDQFAS